MNPRYAAPGRPTRVCRRCRTPQPTAHFPLWTDPVAVARQWATRHWCEGCLVTRGHLTSGQMRRLKRAREKREEQQAAAEAAEAEFEMRLALRDQHVKELWSRLSDDDFAAAFERVARWWAEDRPGSLAN